MIIFNNKGMVSNFIKHGTDTRVFDIHSSVSIEELYDYLLHNEGLPDNVEVAQYNTSGARSQFESIQDTSDENILTAGTVRKWGDAMEEQDEISQIEAMKNARRRAAGENDSYRLEALYNGFSVVAPNPDEGSTMSFGRFTEVDVNRTELISHLADALGVYPSLASEPDISLEEKQQLGKDANRLRWIFAADNLAKIPPLEWVRMFGTLDKYEKAIIADGLYFPGDMLRNAAVVKRDHPQFILTPDILNRNHFFGSASSVLLDNCHQFFVEEYGRAPRVLNEYVNAQVMCGITSAVQIVNEFSLDSLRAVAQYGSPVLYAMVPHINFAQCKKDQIYFLATHVHSRAVKSLLEFHFGEWFAQHRNESLSDLTELLLSYRPEEIKEWNLSMTARQIIEDLKTRKGREDCANYEARYHYHFSDNEVAIKGKGIVVRDGAFKMYFLSKDDYRNFTVGYDTHCCQHWGGAGGSCVYKYTTDPFAACVVIERAGKVVGQAFVFTDEVNDTFVFDNFEFANDRVVADYANIIATFVKALPYKNVHMGTGYVVGQYTSWGQSLGTGRFNMAQMPTTLDGSHVYTDYHSNARVFKADDMMLIRQGNAFVERHEGEPTRWDALRDSRACFLLNEFTMSVDERLSFSNRGIEAIDEARQLAILIRNPAIADSMESVPEEWQRQMISRRVHPKSLQYIKNPIREVRDLVLPVIPSKVLDWADATREDWLIALRKEPALTEKYPGELDTEMASSIYEACGEKSLAYIPMTLLNDELISRIIDTSPRTILSLDNPSEELLVRAVAHEPLLLTALPVISDSVGHAAVSALPAAIIYWPDAPFSECEAAVIAQPTLIRNLAHRFPILRETAIRTNPESIWAVPNATDEEQALARQVTAEQNGVGTEPVDFSNEFILGQFPE